jgi:bisphosphoglycerate-dependent phosphoglycerate mutase
MSKTKYTIVFVRHGESEWNQKNLFCGWHDADLSDTGLAEAKNAGQVIFFYSCDHSCIAYIGPKHATSKG